MNFAGVVVWYNPSDDCKKNISTYISEIDKLYIIDNSNKKNDFPENDKIEYIFNNKNLGIAKALNIASHKAIDENYDWLLTMDQDSSFNNNSLSLMKKFVSNNDVKTTGIVSPWHKTKLHKIKPDKQIDHPLDVMTSGNLLNLKVFSDIGDFKDEFFIDGVDMEYCLRLNKYGFHIDRLNYVELNHNLGDIEYKKVFKKELLCLNHNYLRVYYKVRNYNYIKKEYGKLYPEYCNKIVKIKALIWCIIFYEKDKLRKIRSIFYALSDFKKNIYGEYRH